MLFQKKRNSAGKVQQDAQKPGLFRRAALYLSSHLQRLEAKLSNGQKKLMLALFLLLFGGYSTAILIRTFAGEPSTTLVLYPQRMVAPMLQPDIRTKSFAPLDSIAVQGFARAVDSMLESAEGRLQVEDFFARRPGLRDTLFQLQQKISHQKK